MVLKENSFVVQLAYGEYPPHDTDLCTVFWRVVGKLLFLSLVGGTAGIMLSLLVVGLYSDPVLTLLKIGLGFSIAALAVGAIFMLEWLDNGGGSRINRIELIKFIKGHYCPKIIITR